MPILVSCTSCGKKLKVPDDRVGKMAKCPGCMGTFLVTAGGAAPAPPVSVPAVTGSGRVIKAPKNPVEKKSAGGSPGVAISWGFIAMIFVGVAIPASIAVFYFGPIRVSHQWQAIIGQAEDDVRDVVGQGMKFHETGGVINIKGKGHYSGGVREGPSFRPPFLVMSLPKMIDFVGTTTQGEFKGKYNTKTGEVDCDAELGGLTVGGLDKAVRHGDTKIHITGKMVNHEPVVQVDGKDAVIKIINKDEE